MRILPLTFFQRTLMCPRATSALFSKASLCVVLILTGCLRHRPAPEQAAVLLNTARPDLDAVLLHPAEKRLAHILQLTSSQIVARHPAQSVDGTTVAYEASLVGTTNGCSQIFVVDADGFDDRLVSNGGAARSPSFSPSSTLLLYTEQQDTSPCTPSNHHTSSTSATSAHHAHATHSPSPHTPRMPGVLIARNLDHGDVTSPKGAASFEGKILEATYGPDARHIAIIAIDEETARTTLHLLDTQDEEAPAQQLALPPSVQAPLDVAFDASATRLIFTAQPDPARPHVRELYLWEIATGTLEQITHDGALHAEPIFHPDNIHILFSSNIDASPDQPRRDIFMMQHTGTHLERITFAEGNHSAPSLAAQGSRIAFTSTRAERGGTRPTTAVFVADFLDNPMHRQLRLKGQAVIERQSLTSRIETLASAPMEGREAGTNGEKKTIDYLINQFEFAGLLPHPSLGGWRQEFAFEARKKGEGEEPLATVEQRTATNVIGWLPAREDGIPTKEVLVLGAHHDHAGLGKSWLALDEQSRDKLHPGADDNASGVAALLEIAEALRGIEGRERDVLFVAFGAEEYGLHGSKALVDANVIDPTAIVAMINLDMVGRLEQKALIIRGDESAPQWRSLIRRHHPLAGLDITFEDVGKGNTDFISFFQKEVPVIGLFTGYHDDYHRPGDTPDKIDYDGLEKIVHFTTLVSRELLQSPRRLTFYTSALH